MTAQQTVMLKLHNKVVLGQTLTKTERQRLEAWYEEQDRLEYEEIIGEPKKLPKPPLQKLLEELAAATGQLQTVLRENEKFREQNAQLRYQIAQQL